MSFNEIFQHADFSDYLIRHAHEDDDQQLLALVSETMPSNGMLLAFQREPSYFHATHVQYNQPEIVVVVHRDHLDRCIAMMNIGVKSVFIEGEVKNIRYVSDLRINREFRAKKTIEFLMLYLKSKLESNEFVQSIVLKDNLTARHILHQSRQYFPTPYVCDELTTYTVSRVSPLRRQFKYQIEKFSPKYALVIDQFIDSMKEYYNFLPNYQFSEFAQSRDNFWRDFHSEDLYLVFNENRMLVGIFSIWDQKSFKQTKVIEYSAMMRMIKPFYNVYANLTSNLVLPEQQDCFKYMMTHNVICDPYDTDLFHYCLAFLNEQTQLKGANAFCITLSQTDPRSQVMKHTRHHKIHAIHALHSFDDSPMDRLDRTKITYFEVGRI